MAGIQGFARKLLDVRSCAPAEPRKFLYVRSSSFSSAFRDTTAQAGKLSYVRSWPGYVRSWPGNPFPVFPGTYLAQEVFFMCVPLVSSAFRTTVAQPGILFMCVPGGLNAIFILDSLLYL